MENYFAYCPFIQFLGLVIYILRYYGISYGKSKEQYTIFRPNPRLRLMGQVRQGLGYYHYAYRTEQIYSHWILLHGLRDCGGTTHLNRPAYRMWSAGFPTWPPRLRWQPSPSGRP